MHLKLYALNFIPDTQEGTLVGDAYKRSEWRAVVVPAFRKQDAIAWGRKYIPSHRSYEVQSMGRADFLKEKSA